jgi:hypothetical protein
MAARSRKSCDTPVPDAAAFCRFATIVPHVLSAILSSGCGGGSETPTFVERDSAGVALAESGAPQWAPGEEWRLSAEPALEIGQVEGATEYLLFRVGRPFKLADGRIVVANRGSSEIRFYDSIGVFIRAVGGQGAGPAEFGSGPSLWRWGADSLLAFDGMGQRVSVFDTAGTFARSFRLEWDASFRYTSVLQLAGPLDYGSLLVRQNPNVPLSEAGWGRRILPFLRYGSDGYLIDRVITLQANEYRVFDGDVTAPDGRTFPIRGGTSFPYSREAVWTVHNAHLYYSSNDAFEVAIYGGRGGLVRLIRRLTPLEAVTEADIADARRLLADEGRLRFAGMSADPFGEAPIPTTKPPIAEIRVDANGNVWVRHTWSRWAPDSDMHDHLERRWTVFASRGAMLGDVVTPPRFRLSDIGDDYVLGVWRDEVDVERIREYRLIKP